MTEYTITIEGFTSGLTRKTVEQQFREEYEIDESIEVYVSESDDTEYVDSQEVLEYLNELKQEFSVQEDAYANISMTMNYIEDTGYYNDITRPDES